LSVNEDLSPSILQKITFLGTKLPSFHDAFEATSKLLRMKICEKRVERITERIGGERVAQREDAISNWSELKLTEEADGDTSPRMLVTKTLKFAQWGVKTDMANAASVCPSTVR
jgi:hypothetical protein